MKKRWMVCALLLMVMVTLLTTVAFAGVGGWYGSLFQLFDDEDKSGAGWNWDASERTLTLENADISDNLGIFHIHTDNAVVVLKGENKLEAHDNQALRTAIWCDGDLSVTGDGSLKVSSNYAGIRTRDDIEIYDTTITFSEMNTAVWCEDLEVVNSKIKIEDAVVGIRTRNNCTFRDSEVMIENEFYGLDVGANCRIEDSEVMIESETYGICVDENCWIKDSEVMIVSDVGLFSLGKKLSIDRSVCRVESVGIGIWIRCPLNVRDSEVYLHGDNHAFRSFSGKLSSNVPVRAGMDADSLKPAEYGRFGNFRTFLVDGKPAKVVHIDSALEEAAQIIIALENENNAQILFTDVTAQTEYCDAIAEAYSRGLMGGVSATEFAPDDTLTRAMVWTVLARANGINTEIGATWDSAGRDWAMREKVSDGTNPNGAVTVEELVTMAWRNVGSPYRVADLGDADVSEWAVEAMRWAYETGILSRGIDPKGNATRALTAHVLTAG